MRTWMSCSGGRRCGRLGRRMPRMCTSGGRSCARPAVMGRSLKRTTSSRCRSGPDLRRDSPVPDRLSPPLRWPTSLDHGRERLRGLAGPTRIRAVFQHDAGWMPGFLPSQLAALTIVRNPAAHADTQGREQVIRTREEMLGIGQERLIVKIARAKIRYCCRCIDYCGTTGEPC
jgi:hypothetical protein